MCVLHQRSGCMLHAAHAHVYMCMHAWWLYWAPYHASGRAPLSSLLSAEKSSNSGNAPGAPHSLGSGPAPIHTHTHTHIQMPRQEGAGREEGGGGGKEVRDVAHASHCAWTWTGRAQRGQPSPPLFQPPHTYAGQWSQMSGWAPYHILQAVKARAVVRERAYCRR